MNQPQPNTDAKADREALKAEQKKIRLNRIDKEEYANNVEPDGTPRTMGNCVNCLSIGPLGCFCGKCYRDSACCRIDIPGDENNGQCVRNSNPMFMVMTTYRGSLWKAERLHELWPLTEDNVLPLQPGKNLTRHEAIVIVDGPRPTPRAPSSRYTLRRLNTDLLEFKQIQSGKAGGGEIYATDFWH